MKRLALWFLAAITIITVSCEKFDDGAIWDKLNSLESRIVTLEQLCAQMNTNISSLQTIVAALQNNDYVTNIAPITEDGKIIGYTITFSKSGSVTIYHGKDGQNGTNGTNGKDGSTPVIGVKKDSNGIYYWTINGEWLLDNDGNKIKAQGTDGEDGKNGEDGDVGEDGITPKLKIENGYWKVSYDGGNTWEKLGKATGEDGVDGDSKFADVTYDDDCVYITLSDGTELIILRHQTIHDNQIWYISSDEDIITPNEADVFGANIVSNTYKNRKGVITFDGNITSIGYLAFFGCESLRSITIPNSVTSIGESAFYGCSSLTNVTIPNSVTSIGKFAFSLCYISHITIPDGVTSIGESAFSDCKRLTSVTISDSVTSIGRGAFGGCSSLASITIPESVISIGEVAFYDCRLTSIYCKPTTPPILGEYNIFNGFPADGKIYVPRASVEAYKKAKGWSSYAGRIVGYDF